jgi:hypothetical protein
LQKRSGELNSLMADENFWNNREKAQGFIDEAGVIRNKLEPLQKLEKQLDDFRVMLELGEAEPAASQAKVEAELTRDLAKFFKELDALELKLFLNGPHDKKNCIFTINSGAGGTESQDWAEMLSPASKASPCSSRARTPTVFARPNAACIASCASRRSIPTNAATPVLRAWTRLRKSRRATAKSSFHRMNFAWTRFVPAAKAART